MRRALSRARARLWPWLARCLRPTLAVTLLFGCGQPDAAAPQGPPLPRVNGVYLADPAGPAVGIGLARAAGIRVVFAVPELLAAAPTAEVVAIDRAPFDEVDPAWLTEQYLQGRILFTFNVPPSRLMGLTGHSALTADEFYQRWPDRPFYTYVYRREENGRLSHWGDGSDFFHSSDSVIRLLYFQTAAGQADILSRAPLPPPHPTPSRTATRARR